MTAGSYALEPLAGLDPAGTEAARRIYETGFPPELSADFADLASRAEPSETPLALVSGGHPCGFVMLRRLGDTGWIFLRYFVVDERLRGQGVGTIMWERLLAWVRAQGSPLMIFDVEDPGEPGCDPAEVTIRNRRISFYQGNGARLLPVTGYQTPHEDPHGDGWTPMLLMAAQSEPGVAGPGDEIVPAIVAAVYEHRWRLPPDHPRVRATQVTGPASPPPIRE